MKHESLPVTNPDSIAAAEKARALQREYEARGETLGGAVINLPSVRLFNNGSATLTLREDN